MAFFSSLSFILVSSKPNKLYLELSFNYLKLSEYNLAFNKDAFYKLKEFKENSLSVNLREMKVGCKPVSLFKEKVLIELSKKEEMKAIIKSENSNAKIEKAVEFEVIEESIEYFDYLVSQLEK
nr:hypothetical protein [Francisella noatunensis]